MNALQLPLSTGAAFDGFKVLARCEVRGHIRYPVIGGGSSVFGISPCSWTAWICCYGYVAYCGG